MADDNNRTSNERVDHTCKVMLIGDSGVGKTCVLVRYKNGAFLSGSFISTVGLDFRNKIVDVDGTNVKLQIWDTAGQERFRSVTHAYFRDAHALLLLYDVTNKKSFENVLSWIEDINAHAGNDVVVMLLGNKADLTTEKVIKTEQGEKLAKDNNIAFMETSAKTGMNIDLAFHAIAKNLKEKKTLRSNGRDFNMKEYVNKEKKRSGCCS